MADHPYSAGSRYSLREKSKMASKYRGIASPAAQQQAMEGGQSSSSSIAAQQSPQSSPQRRSITPRKMPARQRREEVAEKPDEPQHKQQSTPHKQQPPVRVLVIEAAAPEETENQPDFDEPMSPIGAEQEIRTSAYEKREVGIIRAPQLIKPAYAYHPRLPSYGRFNLAQDLSDELKYNLRKLKNVLKLPKARRFVFCEFFYSGMDQQIFLAESEFSQLMQESFPNLKCKKLRKPEWREVRRLIGKPRRCSQAFLKEERGALEEKRQRIRHIYDGTCTTIADDDPIDVPAHLPRPPVVGQKIYARIRSPKDGIYAATVDAVTEDGYRVIFDDDHIPAHVIKDYEVMFDQPMELLALNYFLEQNRANTRGPSKGTMMQNGHFYAPLPTKIASDSMEANAAAGGGGGVHAYRLPNPLVEGVQPHKQQPVKKATIAKDEKVGNFPVRMLVILVKLCKVIEYKKQLIGQLKLMNDCAERMSMLGSDYPEEFKAQFSQIVLDLDTINRLFHNYLNALQTHYVTLLPHLNEPLPTDRPELLRKTCNTNAFQIVKHCNSELNVRDKRILHLITSLTSILLQVRTIGNHLHKKKFSVTDKNILGETLKQIRSQISPNNAAAFQDHVEVHLKEMLDMMA